MESVSMTCAISTCNRCAFGPQVYPPTSDGGLASVSASSSSQGPGSHLERVGHPIGGPSWRRAELRRGSALILKVQSRLLTTSDGIGRHTLRQQSTFFRRGTIEGKRERRNGGVESQHGRRGGVRALFTGIVEEMGTVKEVKQVEEDGGFEMTIGCSVVVEDAKLGDSIAVNGTCLTVIRFDAESFSVGLAPETLRRTSLGEAQVGALVNLERSLQPNSRMGGHFVQGHVDGTGNIVSFEPEGDSLWVKVSTSPELLRYIVPKGYISVDGTSLTVVNVLDDECAFTFMLVAYTQQKIVVALKNVGNKVNLEADIVGKYVERLLQGYKSPSTA